MKNRFTLGTVWILILGIGVFSCSSDQEKQARIRLEQARNLYHGGQLETAMQLLDSIQIWYPDQFGIVGKALKLQDSVAYDYHIQLIRSASVMLDSLEPGVKLLSKNFRWIPGKAGQPGMYEHKRQTVRNSWNRTFLKVNINDRGEMWLTSHYYGKEWIDHFCIKVYHRDHYIFSDTIPLSNPWNRKVQDMDDKWETIDFREGTDNGVIGFIVDHNDEPLKVRFTGKKFYYIVMEKFDRLAVKEGYELAQVLSEIYQLKQTIKRNQKAIRLLRTRQVSSDTIIRNQYQHEKTTDSLNLPDSRSSDTPDSGS
ncbi:MAG: hypothetical protein J7L89_02225 [Bacteroidales bacterium]|nr:hypothetical protein [Bacteroidales bacterium]